MERLTTGIYSFSGRIENVENDYILRVQKKLSKYEDLEEQGKLLKLPCAVGDTVYTLNPLPSGKIVIVETTADAFFCALGMLEGRFGKTIFLTKEVAEAALKEMSKVFLFQYPKIQED